MRISNDAGALRAGPLLVFPFATYAVGIRPQQYLAGVRPERRCLHVDHPNLDRPYGGPVRRPCTVVVRVSPGRNDDLENLSMVGADLGQWITVLKDLVGFRPVRVRTSRRSPLAVCGAGNCGDVCWCRHCPRCLLPSRCRVHTARHYAACGELLHRRRQTANDLGRDGLYLWHIVVHREPEVPQVVQ